MNYPQKSQQILDEIDKAKKILVNLHRGPDPDSFACAMSLYYFLCSLRKEVDVVVAESSNLSNELTSFRESEIVKKVNYAKFDFSKYDLFISPDSASWQQIVNNPDVKVPNMPIIIIDHHDSNEKFGMINLIEAKAGSCAEVIYKLFEDWQFSIDPPTAQLLLLGIIGDTGGFAFSENSQSLKVAADLMDNGANKTELINKLFRNKSFKQVKAWGEYLTRLELDEEHKFVWTAMPYEVYKRIGTPQKASSTVAAMFISIVDGTNFGIVMEEDEKNVLKLSFRSRSKVDVSKLAEKFGGGGHKMAAGGMISQMPFNEAVEEVLVTARNYAKENKNEN